MKPLPEVIPKPLPRVIPGQRVRQARPQRELPPEWRTQPQPRSEEPNRRTDQRSSDQSQPEGGIPPQPSSKSPVITQSRTKRQSLEKKVVDSQDLSVSPHTSTSVQVITTKPVVMTSTSPNADVPDLAVLSKGKITLRKLLKGDEIKISCLLDIDGKTYVVKAGEGNGNIKDHLINSDLFHRLDIGGVRAPFASELSDEFRKILRGQLNTSNFREDYLSQALGENDQIATMAPGSTVEDIIASRQSVRDLLDIVDNAQNVGDAMGKLTQELKKTLEQPRKRATPEEAQTFLQAQSAKYDRPFADLASEDLQKRTAAIEDLTKDLQKPGQQRILGVMGQIAAIKEQERHGVVTQMSQSLDDLDAANQVLCSHFKSGEGAYALGGMTFVDLLDGMDDRVLGAWNGGNFMFDPAAKNLWCVDNAKSDFGLSQDSLASGTAWRTFFIKNMTQRNVGDTDKIVENEDLGQSIGERLHYMIYGLRTGKNGDLRRNITLKLDETDLTKAAIEKTVDENVTKVQNLVNDTNNGLDPVVRKQMAARLNMLAARKEFTDMLKFDDEFQDVPDTSAPGNLEIVGRKVERATTAIAALVSRSAQRTAVAQKEAEDIKDDIRNHNPAYDTAELLNKENRLAQLGAILADSNGTVDRRVGKALFEAKFRRLLINLDEKDQSLQALSSKTEKPWGNVSAEAVARIRKGAEPWFNTLKDLGDDEGSDLLNAALDALETTAVSLKIA